MALDKGHGKQSRSCITRFLSCSGSVEDIARRFGKVIDIENKVFNRIATRLREEFNLYQFTANT